MREHARLAIDSAFANVNAGRDVRCWFEPLVATTGRRAVQITQLLHLAPAKRQTLLFSATMTESVQALIALSLSAPVRLAADPTASAPTTLRQEVLRLKASASADKPAVLLALCARSLKESRTIVFCAQKWQAHRLKVLMGLAGLPFASELHGDMTQVLFHRLFAFFLLFALSLTWPDVRL